MLSNVFKFATRAAANQRSVLRVTPRRFLNIHEADSQALMKTFGLSVANGGKATTADAAADIAATLPTGKVVVKAQVLAGGRGKGHFDNGFQGGVHLVDNNANAVKEMASNMLGHNLITKQTGEDGRPCNMVMVAQAVNVQKEYYVAILLDRALMGPVMIGSSEGGMNIEDVAESNPDAIKKLKLDITQSLSIDDAEAFAKEIGFPDTCSRAAGEEFVKLYDLFLNTDCSMIEVNPFAQISDTEVLSLDAKLNFDDNAEFRQKDVFELRDISQENANDVEASEYDLNYIDLDGTIGCLVNGAGLAMATMDIIELHGGSPANFLDVGGSATVEQVTAAFRLITSDPDASAIFVNIFGGIMHCDVIAEGIITAAKQLELTIPVVVRLQGTNSDKARKLIDGSGLGLVSCDELDTAAQRVVELAAN
eukprot:m.25597 g.25597  ORF g.25597 m.25597 type:complete len:423 (-) comp9195_c0_seq1:200-1468(-)